MSTLTTVNLWRCKWCINRVGHATWFNEKGQTVVPPKWAIPTEAETSDGICPTCLTDELAKPIAKEAGR